MDGPVVIAAQRALETGNFNVILIWVQKKDEDEVRRAFEKALAIRKLSAEAKELVDMYFFETVVRLHRAGEGAPYTGLKPAGRDLAPAILAADKALKDQSVEPLLKLLGDTVREGVREHFTRVLTKAAFDEENTGAGQACVKEFVEYIHCVERIYEAASSPASGHFRDPED